MDKNAIRHQFTTKPSSTRLRAELSGSRDRQGDLLDRFETAVPTPEIPGPARNSRIIKKAAVLIVTAAMGAALIHEAAGAAGNAIDHAPQPPAPLQEQPNR